MQKFCSHLTPSPFTFPIQPHFDHAAHHFSFHNQYRPPSLIGNPFLFSFIWYGKSQPGSFFPIKFQSTFFKNRTKEVALSVCCLVYCVLTALFEACPPDTGSMCMWELDKYLVCWPLRLNHKLRVDKTPHSDRFSLLCVFLNMNMNKLCSPLWSSFCNSQ